MNVVISQPMFFPWVGLIEQVRLADQFVFYDDVQFSKGSFVNRVQIKTASGIKWLTVPLKGVSLGQRIQDVQVDHARHWQRQHLDMLKQAYAAAPFLKDMLRVVQEVHDVHGANADTIGALSEASMVAVCRYFGLDTGRQFHHIGELAIGGSGSQRVLDIVQHLHGSRYITGLGAANYLDHEAFAQAGVAVEYMAYRKTPYPQLHGEFTPYVSILDLIANVGHAGIDHICSGTTHWKEFLHHERD